MLIKNQSDIEQLAWEKMQQLLPAIVQDAYDGRVLMQAFMSPESLQKSLSSGKVTFWSRSQQALWTKGETSGHYLNLKAIHSDCDGDSLLILADPVGPTCHTGKDSCFDQSTTPLPELAFLSSLEKLICSRQSELPTGSYTTELFQSGVKRMAQKVGEEGVETSLAAVAGDKDELLNESADLLFHLLVLLRSREVGLEDVIKILEARHAG